MLIARIRDEYGFEKPRDEVKPSSKFEEVIREAGVFGNEIRCRLHEGHLSIHGQVASFCQKQLAQEAVRILPGVIEITNHLQVSHSMQRSPI